MTASVEGRAALLHGGNTGQDGALKRLSGVRVAVAAVRRE